MSTQNPNKAGQKHSSGDRNTQQSQGGTQAGTKQQGDVGKQPGHQQHTGKVGGANLD